MIERSIIEKIDTEDGTSRVEIFWKFIAPLKMCFEALCEQIPEGTNRKSVDIIQTEWGRRAAQIEENIEDTIFFAVMNREDEKHKKGNERSE